MPRAAARTACEAGTVTAALGMLEREADGEPDGLLILHHGRGADEQDLLGLGDVLDPPGGCTSSPRRRRCASRAAGQPLVPGPACRLPGPAASAALRALAAFHDELWERTGSAPTRTVLGGFSMGTVMSYALGLGPSGPRPAGILAFSGFVPTVEDWQPDLANRRGLRTFIAHGRRDPVIEVSFGRSARDLLKRGGLEVSYHEGDLGHQIDPSQLGAALSWLNATIVSR